VDRNIYTDFLHGIDDAALDEVDPTEGFSHAVPFAAPP